jgi:hypothetical protein
MFYSLDRGKQIWRFTDSRRSLVSYRLRQGN